MSPIQVRETIRRSWPWALAGAILSLLVAFASAAWGPAFSWPLEMSTGEAADFFAARHPAAVRDGMTFTGATKHAPGRRREEAMVAEHGPDGYTFSHVFSYRYGWPLPCVRGEHHFGEHIERDGLRWAVVLPDWMHRGERIFGYRPEPLGLLVDIAFYGGVPWLLLTTARRVRGAVRARGGRCRRCGYPVGISNACSECGCNVRTIRPRSSDDAGA